jgi:hypothetical protein
MRSASAVQNRARTCKCYVTAVCVNTCTRLCVSVRVCTRVDVNRRPFRYTRHVPAMYRLIVFPARRGNFSQPRSPTCGRPPPKTLDETLACKYVTESRVFHRDVETPRDSPGLLLCRYPEGRGLGKFHPVRQLKGSRRNTRKRK